MSRPRLLDAFCGAGGAGRGYHQAGFEVVGVDCRPMPNYPFEFHQADALEYIRDHGDDFDVIHASPPCQHYTPVTAKARRYQGYRYADLVAPTRELLRASGKVYVIENVSGAPLARGGGVVLRVRLQIEGPTTPLVRVECTSVREWL